MTEKVLIGTTFWGLAIVAMEKLNVYGFSLYFFPFMFKPVADTTIHYTLHYTFCDSAIQSFGELIRLSILNTRAMLTRTRTINNIFEDREE